MQSQVSPASGLPSRPVVYDFASIPQFLDAMVKWRRQVDPSFSVRGETSEIPGLSHSLVSQVVRGRRSLTPDRLPLFAKLLELNAPEITYLSQRLDGEGALSRRSTATGGKKTKPEAPKSVVAQHLLQDWIHPYVKDTFGLRGSSCDPVVIHRLLGGIAPVSRITRSLQFLLREGFLRRAVRGQVVKNDNATITASEIPNARIRASHKKALELAKNAIDLYPVGRRRAFTQILTLNESSLKELNELVNEFEERMIRFLEEHPHDDEGLYQMVLHLSPIGGKNES